MTGPVALRIRRSVADLNEADFTRVELDGEMGAAGKRARNQLEHKHETAGSGQEAAPRSARCAYRDHGWTIAQAIGVQQLRSACLALS